MWDGLAHHEDVLHTIPTLEHVSQSENEGPERFRASEFLIGLAQHVVCPMAPLPEEFFHYGGKGQHTLFLALPDWSDGRKLMRMTRILAKPMGARNPQGPRSEGGHSTPSRSRRMCQRLNTQSLFKF